MTSALDGAARAFARRPRVLVALDFDGTLAPLVDEPSAARATPSARAALQRLVPLDGVHVALVSGRALDDLRELAEPPAGALLVGSHGVEVDGAPSAVDDAARSLLAKVVAGLQEVAARHPGAAVEVKPASAVLHTRRAARADAAVATDEALAAAAALPGVHVTPGKEVVEVAVVRVGKGEALRRLRRQLGVDAVLYAGDDTTDEDAFAVLDDDAGDVSVKVGEGVTQARHRLASPDDVPRLLDVVAAARG